MIYNSLNLEAIKFASESNYKPELACVFFKRDATIATDGYILVEISTPAKLQSEPFDVGGKQAMSGCEPFLLPAGELKSIKLKDKKGTMSGVALAHLDNDKAELLIKNAGDESIKIIRREQGKYPDYANLFPTGAPVAEVMLNADYVAELAELCSKLKSRSGMTLKFYADNKPLVIEASNDEQYIKALVMPIVNK